LKREYAPLEGMGIIPLAAEPDENQVYRNPKKMEGE